MPRVMNDWQDRLDRLKLSEVLIARLSPRFRQAMRDLLRRGTSPQMFLNASYSMDRLIGGEWGRGCSMRAYLRHIHAIPREGGANGR